MAKANESNESVISNGAKAAILIIFALLLAGFGVAESLTETEKAALMGMVPKVSDMATSPAALQNINENQPKAGDGSAETANEPAAAESSEETMPMPAEPVKEPVSEPITDVSTGALDGYEEVILIPKIDAVLPIIETRSYDLNALHSDLDSGAVLYPASALFGQTGQTVLLGHSAPDNWPDIKHDTAFSRIDELAAGDTITVYYHDKVYSYQVTRSEIIAKGGDLSGSPPAGNSLVLMTCWPPGRDQKRIAVESVLIKTE